MLNINHFYYIFDYLKLFVLSHKTSILLFAMLRILDINISYLFILHIHLLLNQRRYLICNKENKKKPQRYFSYIKWWFECCIFRIPLLFVYKALCSFCICYYIYFLLIFAFLSTSLIIDIQDIYRKTLLEIVIGSRLI